MSQAVRARRRLALKILLAVCSVSIPLLCAEAYVRIFLKNRVDTERILARLNARNLKNFMQPSLDPSIHVELRPNHKVRFCKSWVITGPDRWRISENEVPVPSDAARLAILGDSVSFGWAVDHEDSYGCRFRRMMAETIGQPIAFKNLSVPTHNSQQELEVLRKKVLPYKPDLLILHHNHNDSEPIHPFRNSLHPAFGDNVLHSALIKYIMRKYSIFHPKEAFTYDRSTHEHIGPHIAGGPLYEAHLAALLEMAAIVKANHLPTVVVLHNPIVERDPNYKTSPVYLRLHKRLAEQLSEAGFYVLDLYPLYQEHLAKTHWPDLNRWWVSTGDFVDSHPNPEGHRFIAERLAEFTRVRPELMAALRRQ